MVRLSSATKTQTAAAGATLLGSLKGLGAGFVALAARILPLAAVVGGVVALGAIWDSYNTSKTGAYEALDATKARQKAIATGSADDFRAAESTARLSQKTLDKAQQGIGGALLYKIPAAIDQAPLPIRAALGPMANVMGWGAGKLQPISQTIQDEMVKQANLSRVDATRWQIRENLGSIADPLSLANRAQLPQPASLAKALNLGDPRIKDSRVAALNKLPEATLGLMTEHSVVSHYPKEAARFTKDIAEHTMVGDGERVFYEGQAKRYFSETS